MNARRGIDVTALQNINNRRKSRERQRMALLAGGASGGVPGSIARVAANGGGSISVAAQNKMHVSAAWQQRRGGGNGAAGINNGERHGSAARAARLMPSNAHIKHRALQRMRWRGGSGDGGMAWHRVKISAQRVNQSKHQRIMAAAAAAKKVS